MLYIIKKHWFILIPAFFVGVAVVLPTILSVYTAGKNFKGVYPTINNDEEYYLSTTKEVYDGKFNSGNPFIKELKNETALQPALVEAVLSNEAKILNFSVPKTFAVNDFFLPFIGVILLYALFFSITKSRIISGISSFLFFLTFLISFNRPISPQFNFIFFVLGILVLHKIFSKDWGIGSIFKLNILLSVIFASLVYSYPFYWTAIVVLYGVNLFLLIISQGNYSYYFKNVTVFGFCSLLLVIPYLLNLVKSASNPYFIEASLRNGFVFTHFPGAFINVAIIGFCLPILYFIRESIKSKRELIFGYSLVIIGIILNWQNIITGKALQFSSHYYLTIILFVFLIFSICVKALFFRDTNKFSKKEWLSLYMIVALVCFIFYKQKNEIIGAYSSIINPPDISNLQLLAPVVQWLNTNTLKDSVVYSLGKNYDWLIPTYTHNSSYFQTYAGMYLVSDDELENRWVIQRFFDGVTQGDVYGNRDIWTNKYQDTYANKEIRRKILQFMTSKQYSETVLMPQTDVDRVLNKYAQFQKAGFERALKTYIVDYVILDTKDSHYSGLEEKFKNYSFLKLTVNIDGTIIYKVN